MLTFERETTVTASPESVYDLLADLDGHRSWKPFFQLSGSVDPGGDVMVNFFLGRGRKISTPADIVAAKRPHVFAWRFGEPWIFAIEERYTLAAAAGGGTSVVHCLRIMGLLAPLPALFVSRTLRRSLERSDTCLVDRLQKRQSIPSPAPTPATSRFRAKSPSRRRRR
ncbi:hypothetical protein D9601_17260 [Sphingomonas sp. MA1305]|jgi:uncharacterized protein YndB with AHSA1/START domain|uniref:SRPBCC family protein n=1 Tax=Sphingomonas sp. MA1305 TaxID=2479204 RepID=UPI0018DFD9C4|nr:SRPBCC family protein [Sphingomonas sp. MA1305]MBI0477099.1 hypothetical protein [Sphingomonas sp. MA1305]